tara:strand:+ start:270 stop:659 length:390 start_codon:yes stop_codon:yes gene_type:complete
MKLIKQVNFKLCVLFVLFAFVSNAQIPKDKQLHFAAGVIASSAGYTYVWQKTRNKKKAFLAGVGTSILAGTLKELVDSTQDNNYFDTKDLTATALGGITVGVTINLFNKKKYVGINKTILERRVDLLME